MSCLKGTRKKTKGRKRLWSFFNSWKIMHGESQKNPRSGAEACNAGSLPLREKGGRKMFESVIKKW